MSDRIKLLDHFEQNRDYIDAHVNEGISRGRRGTAEITVTDNDGKPVSRAHVHIRQKKHDFQYGCNLFLLDEINDKEKNEACKKKFAELFNQATLPFYWSDLEPQEGALRFTVDSPRIYRRPVPDLCLEWCRQNDIAPKAHCLNYYNETPAWVPVENDAFWDKLETRFSQLSKRYADRIKGWEVTNETLRFYSHKDFSAGTTPFYDPEFIEKSYALAEKYFPENELIINEAHFNIWGEFFKENRSEYYMQIERALLKGSRIDTIGMQYHMFFPKDTEAKDTEAYYDPYTIFACMDRYSDFERPMQITEVTIPAYSEGEEDEYIQAELLRNLYRIWFSNPLMETITYWNLVDGYAWSEDNVPGNMTSGENIYYGGLIRFDGTEKPAYKAIKKLFEEEWHTELETETDENGHFSFEGFYGDYDVTVTYGDATRTLEYGGLHKNGAASGKLIF